MIDNVLIAYNEEMFATGLKNIILNNYSDINVNIIQNDSKIFHNLKDYDFDILFLSFDNHKDISQISNSVKKINPKSKIVLVSRTFSTDEVKECLDYNINGLICRNYPIIKIKSIVNLLLIGEDYYPHDLLSYKNTELTKQQVNIINHLTKGYSNKQIAYEMNITESTVKAHMSILMKKLKVTNRMQVIKKAMDLGYVEY